MLHYPNTTGTQELAKNPLGRASRYPQDYAPEVLCAISRSKSRGNLRSGNALPFHGEDLWNAWELTWLNGSGRPTVATARIRVPADSENIVESKSLKLYLNSFSMSRYGSAEELQATITSDLGRTTNSNVTVTLTTAAESVADTIGKLPGTCIDDAHGDFLATAVDATLLKATRDTIVSEELHSHLLRSNCPVTNQPDLGSILIRYRGPQIDRSGLLQYIVSFRQHNDFHEACVERIFMDLKKYCEPSQLTVYARYTRRGGIDINPFRSDFEDAAANTRLWRQ
ncbi:MAG: NADPH-dependent 7-cyano-7-deazaguanine reductase QueF [Gammaproteobacteria bacterium]|nr:NADPH-dependent 7-cyano-7-deazaguanine reductase QueF [Gammaproteobacteria bacterium]